jgi:hypothetical protein
LSDLLAALGILFAPLIPTTEIMWLGTQGVKVMAPEQTTNSSPGITPLITGIVNDAQALIRQQLTLFQTEVKNDLHRTKEASIPLAVGAIVCFLAGIILCIAIALLIVYLWPACPYFVAFGIVGVVLAIVGGVLVYTGKAKFDAFNPLPEKAVEGLKENIQWKTKM